MESSTFENSALKQVPQRSALNYLFQGYDALLDFVFYPYCYLCEERLISGKLLICAECWEGVRYPAGGKLLAPVDFHLQQRFQFDKAFALYVFSEKTRQLIHLFKYDRKTTLGEQMGKDAGQFIVSMPDLQKLDILLPVPLHPVRRRERGYNQSEILAEHASLQCGIPMLPDIIKRTVNNPSQTGLDLADRKRNVDGIFEIEKPEEIKGKRILLIDDVITSGVTMNECAKLLKKKGALEVLCLAVIHPEVL